MKLSDLKKEAQALGLTVQQSGRREARGDYTFALRNHYLSRDFPSGLPYEELSPMLCFNFWELHPKQQALLWKSSDWIIQEKLNGCRLILHFVKGVRIPMKVISVPG